MGRRPFVERLQEFRLLTRVHGNIGFGVGKFFCDATSE
jgi:hypothetical protein